MPTRPEIPQAQSQSDPSFTPNSTSPNNSLQRSQPMSTPHNSHNKLSSSLSSVQPFSNSTLPYSSAPRIHTRVQTGPSSNSQLVAFNRLVLTGLHRDVTEDLLQSNFSQHFSLHSINLSYVKADSKSVASVQLVNDRDVPKFIEIYQNYIILGQPITIQKDPFGYAFRRLSGANSTTAIMSTTGPIPSFTSLRHQQSHQLSSHPSPLREPSAGIKPSSCVDNGKLGNAPMSTDMSRLAGSQAVPNRFDRLEANGNSTQNVSSKSSTKLNISKKSRSRFSDINPSQSLRTELPAPPTHQLEASLHPKRSATFSVPTSLSVKPQRHLQNPSCQTENLLALHPSRPCPSKEPLPSVMKKSRFSGAETTLPPSTQSKHDVNQSIVPAKFHGPRESKDDRYAYRNEEERKHTGSFRRQEQNKRHESDKRSERFDAPERSDRRRNFSGYRTDYRHDHGRDTYVDSRYNDFHSSRHDQRERLHEDRQGSHHEDRRSNLCDGKRENRSDYGRERSRNSREDGRFSMAGCRTCFRRREDCRGCQYEGRRDRDEVYRRNTFDERRGRCEKAEFDGYRQGDRNATHIKNTSKSRRGSPHDVKQERRPNSQVVDGSIHSSANQHAHEKSIVLGVPRWLQGSENLIDMNPNTLTRNSGIVSQDHCKGGVSAPSESSHIQSSSPKATSALNPSALGTGPELYIDNVPEHIGLNELQYHLKTFSPSNVLISGKNRCKVTFHRLRNRDEALQLQFLDIRGHKLNLLHPKDPDVFKQPARNSFSQQKIEDEGTREKPLETQPSKRHGNMPHETVKNPKEANKPSARVEDDFERLFSSVVGQANGELVKMAVKREHATAMREIIKHFDEKEKAKTTQVEWQKSSANPKHPFLSSGKSVKPSTLEDLDAYLGQPDTQALHRGFSKKKSSKQELKSSEKSHNPDSVEGTAWARPNYAVKEDSKRDSVDSSEKKVEGETCSKKSGNILLRLRLKAKSAETSSLEVKSTKNGDRVENVPAVGTEQVSDCRRIAKRTSEEVDNLEEDEIVPCVNRKRRKVVTSRKSVDLEAQQHPQDEDGSIQKEENLTKTEDEEIANKKKSVKKRKKGQIDEKGSKRPRTGSKSIGNEETEKMKTVSSVMDKKKCEQEPEVWIPISGERFVEIQMEKMTEEELKEVKERDGICARTQPYVRGLKKKVNEAPIVRPNEEPAQSSRASRQQRRMFRKGMSLINPKSEVLTVSMLQQRRKRVYTRKSTIHGEGLYAQDDIEAHEFVIEYVGSIIRRQIADLREREYERKGIGDSYLFRLNGDFVIDATQRGGIARFINHSCDPNLTAKVMSIGGTDHIVFYSKKAIKKHDELTYDYKFDIEGDDKKIECLCKSANCRKYLN